MAPRWAAFFAKTHPPQAAEPTKRKTPRRRIHLGVGADVSGAFFRLIIG
jgi:hypothetical protein